MRQEGRAGTLPTDLVGQYRRLGRRGGQIFLGAPDLPSSKAPVSIRSVALLISAYSVAGYYTPPRFGRRI
jgi:hypothetical protein